MPRLILVSLAVILGSSGLARACPISLTLRKRAAEVDFVVLVTPTRTFSDANATGVHSEVRIDKVLKGHAALGKAKTLMDTEARAEDPKKPGQFLEFGKVGKGGGFTYEKPFPVTSPAAVEYVQKQMAIKPSDTSALLRHCFQYLEHADEAIAEDAWEELYEANRKDLRKAASKFSPAVLRRHLKSAKVAPIHKRFYAFLLGACGTDRDARYLLAEIRREDETFGGADEGLLMGFIQLRPREGWRLVYNRIVRNRQENDLQLDRESAHATARYLWEERPDLVSRAEVEDAVCRLLVDRDLAAAVIHDLRRWKCRKPLVHIVNLYQGYSDRDRNEAYSVLEAIVCYALSASDEAAAAEFLRETRKTEPLLCAGAERLLELEKNEK